MLGPDSVRDLQGVEFRLEHPDAHAAAALNGETKASSGEFLIVSPYPTQPHLLDLKPLNESQRLLAKALQILEPTRNDYATAPYAAAFNWASVTAELRNLAESMQYDWKTQYFYIVVFRSQIPPTTNRVELGELDQRSHAEATKSGGLLKYWFGQPDENGRNLATCEVFEPLFPWKC